MKVRCIKVSLGDNNLTRDKVYDVLKEDESCYLIINDLGETRWFMKVRFIESIELFPIF